MARVRHDMVQPGVGASGVCSTVRRCSAGAAAAALDRALAELDALEAAVPCAGEPAAVTAASTGRVARHVERLRHQLRALRPLLADAAQFAYHDALTGLPNRALLLDRMEQATARAMRRHLQVGVLLVDLDGLKGINDRFGHHAGDRVLVHFSRLLAGCIRKGDTACRYGGDEFVVMLPEIAGMEAMSAVAAKLAARLRAPVAVDGHEIRVRASIGMALYPSEAATVAEALQRADAAMYRMKSAAGAARLTRASAASPATPGWRSPAGRSP